MLFFILKSLISGVMIAAAASCAKRYPGVGALIVSLPLVSIMTMLWLWYEKPDILTMADHMRGTFFYTLPSLPMFLLMPMLLKLGYSFYISLLMGCLMTILLYGAMMALNAKMHLF